MSIRRAATALAVLALAGCGTAPAAPAPQPPPVAEPPHVLTSTPVYASIAQAIGGGHITVDAVVSDPGVHPPAYRTSASDAGKMAEADVVVVNGAGYDNWMFPLIGTSVRNEPFVIKITELSGLTPTPDAPDDRFDAHLWYHLPTVRKLASTLAAGLGAIDPAHAGEYTANAEVFDGRVVDLLRRTQAVGTAHGGAPVLVDDPRPGYLVQAAGLADVTPPALTEVIAATDEGTGPPVPVLRQALDDVLSRPVEAAIIDSGAATASGTTIREAAQAAGVPVVDLPESLPAGTDYVSWMTGRIDALDTALAVP